MRVNDTSPKVNKHTSILECFKRNTRIDKYGCGEMMWEAGVFIEVDSHASSRGQLCPLYRVTIR